MGDSVWGFHVLRAHYPPSSSLCSPTQKLQNPIVYGVSWNFIMQARLIRSPAIGDCPLSPAPLPSLEVWGGVESSHPLILLWSFPAQPPSCSYLGAPRPPVTSSTHKRHCYHSRDSQSLRSFCVRNRDQDQIGTCCITVSSVPRA